MKEPIILHLETSTSICSVALSKGENLLAHRETNVDKSHSSIILDYINSVLQESEVPLKYLNAISCSTGPGSYTGLRIGVSTAKGLAYGLKIPVIDLPVLDTLANEMLFRYPDFKYYIPVIDARRMEVYLAVYEKERKIVDFKPMIIENKDVFNFLDSKNNIILSGYGVEKLSSVLPKESFKIETNIKPCAIYNIRIAYKKFIEKIFSDSAYLNPIYLK
ncbi:MAG: tRNA (adenosine(37)-N6)-threonylcarbamoyltransferase complex dimerization subunit type 1 TsaB [Chitinophagaceae bacterium]|nr:MAG: tRNA (adenosine(37)-N6)-threonylcarbamoyltransferase complex dimerization subunit type 1 TsaB [Chitinophagaceae bacterium]